MSTCERCGGTMPAPRGARFCSTRCRVAYWRAARAAERAELEAVVSALLGRQ